MPESNFNLPENEWERAKYLALQYGLDALQFLPKPSQGAISCIPLVLAEAHEIFPLAVGNELDPQVVKLAVADPTDLDTIDRLQHELNLGIECVVAPRKEILRAISIYYRNDH